MNIKSVRNRLEHELQKIGLRLLPPNDEVFAEEIGRTCLFDPFRERAYFMPTTSVLVNDRLVAQCKRIFDITTSSSHGQALYSIEELKKIPKLGYSLENGYLAHPHNDPRNPTPSFTDLANFFATDMVLGVALNYLIVSAAEDIVSIKAFTFKNCHACACFAQFTKASLAYPQISREAESR